jgi:anti-sigma regulatory factor (Ser/Thr protein kinase)
MCWQIEQQLHADLTAPAVARAHIAAELHAVLGSTERSELVEDAQIITSELVTNAVNAGSESVNVRIRLHTHELEIEVTDTAAGWPTIQQTAPRGEHGRGLVIVSALTSSWATKPTSSGKSVSARLPVSANLTQSLGCRTAPTYRQPRMHESQRPGVHAPE